MTRFSHGEGIQHVNTRLTGVHGPQVELKRVGRRMGQDFLRVRFYIF
jgi:hypothetical protein